VLVFEQRAVQQCKTGRPRSSRIGVSAYRRYGQRRARTPARRSGAVPSYNENENLISAWALRIFGLNFAVDLKALRAFEGRTMKVLELGPRCLFIAVALLGLFAFFASQSAAAEIPPKPARYFNDFARLVRPETAQMLNQQLADFERQTSNQILVVIYPNLPADTTVEDFAQDSFRAWKPGQQGRNNGAILFVFLKERKMRIQTGYGLEGALPDAICKRIISDEMAPRFQAGDFDGGMNAGVNAMLAAARGEYAGNGRTVADARRQAHHNQETFVDLLIFLVVFAIIGISLIRAARRGTVYTSRSRGPSGTWWIGGGGFGGGGGGGSSGGGGDGGGFSGGGGDSGGGGASGGW
jgi:uncharacterized protein